MADLEAFAKNVFVVDGPDVRFIGISFPTRMIIVKLKDGSLWINSPVSVPAETLDRIRALGPVQHLVAPTKLHVWRLEEWHALFPEAAMWAPPQIPNQFKRLPFRGMLQDEPPSAWKGDFDQLIFSGNLFMEEVYFCHKDSRTLIFADFIQNHAPAADNLPLRALVWADGIGYPRGGVPRDLRLSFTDRNAARQSLEKLLAWDFDKLILAHGVCIEKDAKPFVQRAFRWLRK